MFSIPVRQVSDNLQILDEVARRPDGLLIARDGQIDLVGTSASDADIAPRVEAAKVAIEDLIEACARSNLHSSLHRFAERYLTELGGLHSGEPGLTWYIVAQRIEPGSPRWVGLAGPKTAEMLAKLPVPSFTLQVCQNLGT